MAMSAQTSTAPLPITTSCVPEAGVPFTSFDGDQADYRNYSEAQFETRIQGLVEVMKQNKEAKNNG